jgi:hypothetical protein
VLFPPYILRVRHVVVVDHEELKRTVITVFLINLVKIGPQFQMLKLKDMRGRTSKTLSSEISILGWKESGLKCNVDLTGNTFIRYKNNGAGLQVAAAVYLRHSLLEFWRGVGWQLVADVWAQPLCLTLKDGTDRFS